MKDSILLSGATGFVGGALVDSLKGKYDFINIGRGRNEFCKNYYWDLKSKIDCDSKISSKVAIHCASIVGNNPTIDIGEFIDINVKSTAQLLQFCINNNFEKFIFVSTGGVYGFSEKPAKEGDSCEPNDLYALTKFFSERVCSLYSKQIQIIILRLYFPYGNYENNRLINNLVKSILTGTEIKINKEGKPIINPTHITDIVNIVDLFINSDLEGIFNISGDECVSIEEICGIIANEAKINTFNFNYTGLISSNMIGCNNKLKELVGYKQKVNLNEGLKRLINYISRQ